MSPVFRIYARDKQGETRVYEVTDEPDVQAAIALVKSEPDVVTALCLVPKK